MEFVSWDDEIPNIWKNCKMFPKPPTSIYCWITKYSSKLYLFGDYAQLWGKKEKDFWGCLLPYCSRVGKSLLWKGFVAMYGGQNVDPGKSCSTCGLKLREVESCWFEFVGGLLQLSPKAFGWRVTRAWKKCKLITPFFALAKVKSAATAHPTTRPSYFQWRFSTPPYIKNTFQNRCS